jgi:hypothetical protein
VGLGGALNSLKFTKKISVFAESVSVFAETTSCCNDDQAKYWPSSSGLRGRRKTYLIILKRAWSANLKMVWYVLLRPLRPELDGQDLA